MPNFVNYFLKKILVFLFFIGFSGTILAQIETNNWYFGKNAGINFNNNQVTLLTDGLMNTHAGCSSFSDKDGALLFYTNGQTVWNKNHQIMENGTELKTDINSPQTSIIIPKPGNDNVFYIFTTLETTLTEPFYMSPGLYYSEVTFSDEFPLGKVTFKNFIYSIPVSSKITAIHHAESNTIRVIAFGKDNSTPLKNRNTFYIINVTNEGVQNTPIMKTVDEEILGLGTMKISPNGKRIALVDDVDRYIYIYDFNNDTIEFSLDLYISPDGFGYPKEPYSVEFSQNSDWIYFSGERTLYQFYLESTEESELIHIDQVNGPDRYGTLQLASNGKIYVAKYKLGDPAKAITSLGVINKPEEPGIDCEYEELSITPNASLKGLPNFIASYLRNRILTENRCVGAVFEFDLDLYKEITAVTWDFGDGTTSTLMTPVHQFTTPGIYTVKAMITINNYPQPLYKTIEVYPLPNMVANQTLKQCDLDNDGISNFNLKNVIDLIEDATPDFSLNFYNSRNDAENDLDEIENAEVFENTTNPQELFVKITSPQGCISVSNFYVETTFTPINEIAPIYTCEDSDSVLNDNQGLFDLASKEMEIRNQNSLPASSMITFFASSLDAETRTNQLPQDYIATSSTIWVRVDNEDFSCGGIGTLQLIVNADLGVDLEDEYLICNPKMQPPIVLNGGAFNDSWEWKNDSGILISTNQEFKLLQAGTYSLTVYRTQNNIQCSVTKEFVVIEADGIAFENVSAENKKIKVSVIGTSDYEFSLDNTLFYGEGTSHTFYDVPGGIYTVYVRDKKECQLPIQIEISLVIYPTFFTPNQDGFNDSWKIEGINRNFYYQASISIFDRYGKLLHSMNLDGNNQEGWNGMIKDRNLLASDYWFKAILVDKNGITIEKRGHFSLIR